MKGLTWTKLPARVMGATREDIGLFLHRCAGLRQACVFMLGEEGRGRDLAAVAGAVCCCQTPFGTRDTSESGFCNTENRT